VSGNLVGESTAQQAEQVFRNLGAVLQEGGVGPDAVVKTTVFLVDLADFAAVNEVYARFFAQNTVYPARSTIQVAALPKGARIEIEAVAQLLNP
jgi:2-iminobutanoate/2-iminopropanoate deaminase